MSGANVIMFRPRAINGCTKDQPADDIIMATAAPYLEDSEIESIFRVVAEGWFTTL